MFTDYVETTTPQAKKKEKKDMIPGGLHVARLYACIDIGTQEGSKQFPTPKRKILFIWELPKIKRIFKEELGKQPLVKEKTYNWNTNMGADKSGLIIDLKSWFSDAQPDGDVQYWVENCIIGKPAYLNISLVQDKNDVQKWYNNVEAVLPLPEDITCPPAITPTVKFDMFGKTFDFDTFVKLPKWIMKKIEESPEYKQHMEQPKEQKAAQVGFETALHNDLPF